MKKTYIAPKSVSITVSAEKILAGSLGVNNTPQNGVSGDAKELIFDDMDDWDY